MLDKGTTKSPGSPLDGATIVLAETVVLDKGNGPQAGNITLATDKGSITNEFRGAVKTAMVDGQPHVTTSGTYKMIDGTGIFAGASGHGTYSASFTSKTDWMGEYKGVLNLPKRGGARGAPPPPPQPPRAPARFSVCNSVRKADEDSSCSRASRCWSAPSARASLPVAP